MAAPEARRLGEALVRLRTAYHRRLAGQLGVAVDWAALPGLVRALDDRAVLAELERRARQASRARAGLRRWLRRVLGSAVGRAAVGGGTR